VNAACNKPARKPDAGNPPVRFDEGEGSVTGPSLLYLSSFDRWWFKGGSLWETNENEGINGGAFAEIQGIDNENEHDSEHD